MRTIPNRWDVRSAWVAVLAALNIADEFFAGRAASFARSASNDGARASYRARGVAAQPTQTSPALP
jgi:hypothetical protein